MSLHHTYRKLKKSLGQELLLLNCLCSVDYDGRSASKIGVGDRAIMIKKDKTIIVHGATKLKPINWQTQTSEINLSLGDGELVISGVRTKYPRETIVIHVFEVYDLVNRKLVDVAEKKMSKMEKDMVDWVASHPEELGKGFKIIGREYPTEYGPIDIYGKMDKDYYVVEFKRLKENAASGMRQLERYQQHFKNYGRSVKCVLVVPDATPYVKQELKKRGFGLKKLDPAKTLKGVKLKPEHTKQTQLQNF